MAIVVELATAKGGSIINSRFKFKQKLNATPRDEDKNQ